MIALILACVPVFQAEPAERSPIIVYFMSDELAYFELSHMGNTKIHTPRIDRMATEGIRFTQALPGIDYNAPGSPRRRARTGFSGGTAASAHPLEVDRGDAPDDRQ